MRDRGPTYGRPTPEQRLFEVARRMTPGTVGGLVRSAAPVQRGNPAVAVRPPSTGRATTMFVAASNATANEKAGADYQCDGTADEVEINNALVATAGSGGLVLLSSGTFFPAANILPGPWAHLAGVGRAATFIDASGSGAGIVLSGYYATLSDFWLFGDGTGTGIEIPNGGAAAFSWNEVDRVIVDTYATGVEFNDASNSVRASQIFSSGLGVSAVDRADHPRVVDVEVNGCDAGIYVDVFGALIEASKVQGSSASGDGVFIDTGGQDAQVVGVSVRGHLNNFHVLASRCQVAANRSYGARNHGFLWAGTGGQLHDNIAEDNGTAANNTYDAFNIAGGTGSSIQGNQGFDTTSGRTRYGIRIEAAVTAALVTNNDVLSGASGTTWGTAAFSDAGTGTITTAGNRT